MEIIAEIGQNHNGDMDLAKKLIQCAKDGGASTAKFQVYDAKVLFTKKDNPWYEYNLKTELSPSQIELLAKYCEHIDIEFMASVFDVERVDWLEKVGVKRYKVASRSVNDRRLMDRLSATGKPVLISLGMWHEKEFPALPTGMDAKFLHCVSKYPTPLVECGADKVDFKSFAGYSDHTMGISSAAVAFSRGAQIVEKHLTLDKEMYGPDHICSMTPSELVLLGRFRSELAEMRG